MNEFAPIAIDCFCGAGGLSIGLEQAGFKIRFAFDYDEDSIRTYNSNPKIISSVAKRLKIESLPSKLLLENAGINPEACILLAGGPPCQGFSVQRIGKDSDPRNFLVVEFINRIKSIKPWFFLMENVPGINGRRGKFILHRLFAELESIGYKISFDVLDAANFGVPQRRRRIFVVGERLPSGIARFSFPTITTFAKQSKVTVRQAIGFLPKPPNDGSDHPLWPNHRRDRLSEKNAKRLKVLKQGQGRVNLPHNLLADCHKISADLIGHRNVYGRMRWNDVAPTITARFDSFTRGQFGHPNDLRSISLREGAILQGFPLKYNFVGTKVSIARQIGNAVPPLLAKAIGGKIFYAYKKECEYLLSQSKVLC